MSFISSFLVSFKDIVSLQPSHNLSASVPDDQKTLFKLGRDNYHTFEIGRGYFLENLQLQFIELGLISGPTNMDQLLLTSDSDSVFARCVNISQEKRLFLAASLRWAGHCYQNIDQYSQAGAENDKRFNFLYGLAEKILLISRFEETHDIPLFASDDKIVKKELVELYYNTNVMMFLRANPGKFIEAAATLDKVLELDSTPAMKVRVGNLRSSAFKKAGIEQTAAEFYRDVLSPYKTLCDSDLSLSPPDRDPFLLPLYNHNYAGLLIKEGKLDEADEALKVTVAYMEDKEHPNFHPYFPQFYLTLANLKELQDKHEEALEAIAKSKEQAKKNPGSYVQDLKK